LLSAYFEKSLTEKSVYERTRIFTREIVGYAMAERMTKNLVIHSLMRAVTAKRPAAGLIHHSDRGSLKK
jgi:transposase InsO family protein